MLNRLRTSPFVKGFLGAIAAIALLLLSLLAIHLWSDHTALHVVVDFLNQHGERISKLP